jgi:hypothetical protein
MYIFRNEEFQTARVLDSTEIWRQFVMCLKKVKIFDTSQSLLQIMDFTYFMAMCVGDMEDLWLSGCF